MKMVNIRNVRGAQLREWAYAGDLVGLMRSRRLIGVMVPVTPNWVAHVIEHNWSRVLQSVTEGEQELARGGPMVTLEDVLTVADEGDPAVNAVPGGTTADRAVHPFLASLGAISSDDSELPPTRNVRVGDLSAAAIERAGEANEILAVTHDGGLLGLVVPITERLTKYLVGKNMSRLLYNISYGEKETADEEKLVGIERAFAEHEDLLAPGTISRR